MMNPSIWSQASPRSNSETKTRDPQTDVYTGISTIKFKNTNTGLTNRCLHRHFHVQIQKQKHRTHKQMFTQAFPSSNSETKTPESQTDVYTDISTFKFRNKNTGVTNRCLKLTIHRTEPYSLLSLLYFCGHLEYVPGAHLEPCSELFGFHLFTQKKLHHRYHNRLGSQYAAVFNTKLST